MKQIIILLSLLTILSPVASFAKQTSQQVPFTQEDKERLIRLEEGQKAINQRLDHMAVTMQTMKDEIKDIRDDVKWNFRILIGAIIALFGFIIWDRRTAISPIEKKIKELEAVIQGTPKFKAKAHK